MMKYVNKTQIELSSKEFVLLVGMAGGLSLLLFLRDVLGIGISKYLFFGYTVGFFAIAQYKTLVYMMCFIFPLLCGLPGTYIMPCALVLLLMKKRHMGLPFLVAVFALALMELIASLWYPNFSFASYVQYISFVLVMFAFIYEVSDVDYLFCVKIFFYGVCVLCAVIMINAFATAPSNWLNLFAKGQFRIGETHTEEIEGMALSLNANSLAYFSIVGVACGIIFIEKSSGKGRINNVLLTVLAAVAGFLTISRSWLIVAVICLILYTASKLRSFKKIIQLGMVLVVAAVLLNTIFVNNPNLLAGFVTRIESSDVAGGHGRVELAQQYLEKVTESPRYLLFGTGVMEYRSLLGMKESAHNGTIQILVSYGILFASLFLFGLIAPLYKLKKAKTSFVWWLPLISVALFVQTIQFINPCFIMLPYGIGVVAVKAGQQPQ